VVQTSPPQPNPANSEAANKDAKSTRPTVRARLFFALRLLGTAAGFAYILTIADVASVLSVMVSIPASAIVIAVALTTLAMAIAAVRWQLLLKSYGATAPPSLIRLFHLYLVGMFYNAFLPGGVGGDVVRGVVSREAFGPAGVTAALTVVFVERVLGLGGLLAVTAVATLVRPLPGLENAGFFSLVGIGLAICTVLGIAAARRLSPLLPGPLSRITARVPAVHSLSGFAWAALISVGTHVLVALSGHVLLSAVAPEVLLTDSLVIVPVAVATAFFPLTVGGAGVREAAFVFLCTTALGVPEADAAATSLLLWFCHLAVAGTGGILQFLSPVRTTPATP